MSDKKIKAINPYSKYEPIFEHWYIKKQIGKGAIGRVYEIEREELGVTYKAALKAISIPDGEEDITNTLASGVSRDDLEEYYRNLKNKVVNEFQFLAKLKGNSYVVNYEDHCVIDKEDELGWDILIKTELLTPLVDHAIEYPLDESDVLKLGMDICRALEYCNQYGIIHRDIKPENIFISPSGDYKLGDFGIARVVEETQMSLSRKGTYSYMSPEVFHGEGYGKSADVYSLGLVMYKYLNHSRSPFMPPYPEKIVYDDQENAFTERMSGKKIPAPAMGSVALKEVVLKACEFDPADRYTNAAEMLEDLEAIQFGRSFKRRRARKLKKLDKRVLIKSVAVMVWLVLSCTFGVLVSMPKEVTDIQGIDDSIVMYYDASMKPEYTIEPKWFEDEPIIFASSDDDVFTVTDQGEINAVAIGEADLTMRAKEYTETVHVSVVPKVIGISGVDKSYNLSTEDQIKLEPILEPAEFENEPVKYKSSKESVASVANDGTVKALSAGEAIITITAGGTSIKSTITVTNSQPVIRYNSSSRKKSSERKKSSGSSDGYFESGDEHF